MSRSPRLRRTAVAWIVGAVCLLVVPATIGVSSADPKEGATSGSAAAAALAEPPAESTPPTIPAEQALASRSVIASTTPSDASAGGAPAAPASTGLVPGAVDRTSMNLSAEYQATVRLNFGTRSFRVSSTMTVTNTSGVSIDRLELNTVAARLGRMTITLARSDGHDVQPTVSDQTIHFPLGGTLPPGATVTVRIDYRATLRSDTTGSNWLFTRANGILEAHRWLPWISRPTPFNRPNHGDPFVTPVSPRVRVTIVSDRLIRWATTGERTSPVGTTTTFEARDVRDFVFAGAPDYRSTSATVGGVVVRVWYRPGFPASTVLSAAKTALSREAALLGPYPYPSYELAQTAGGYGMESPGLTWIPTGAGNLRYLVAHETAHQWFYGIVGNDQARQPFADEAATDFVARHILGLRRASRCSTARLDLTIYQYSSACYYEDIYIQGGNFLDDTRKRMGSTAFWAGIRDYLATYRFRLASTRSLLDRLDAHTPLNLVPRYETRFPSLY
ncbi:MAG TPA: hypothetical protein VK194_10945 [Candidatus Deferrimicrobium sp.]|nr:hypothetical protein [Candidatus Deferrimicrobium sp.]